LNVFAQNFIVTSDTTVSGTHYENNGNTYAALTNSGTWTFTGSNVTLTGTAASIGAGRYSASFTGGGQLNLTDSVIESNGYALYLEHSVTATVTGGTIHTKGNNGFGTFLNDQSVMSLTNVNILTEGVDALGLYVWASTATATGGTIHTRGNGSSGAYLYRSVIFLTDVNILTEGNNAHGLHLAASATATVTGGTIMTSGTNAHGVYANGTSTLSLTDSDINATGSAAYALNLAGKITGTVQLHDNTVTGGFNVSGTSTLHLTASQHTVLTGDTIVSGPSSLTADLDNSVLNSAVTASDDSQITLTGSNGSTIIGNLTGNDKATIAVTLSGSDTWYAGDLTANDHSTVTINGDGHLAIGDLTASGTATIDLTLTGSVNRVTGNDEAAINLTVTGSHSAFLGDINQNDHAIVTIGISDGATGSGGFTGGHLSVGSDSTWDFTKNSTTDRIDNHGIIYLGAHDNYLAVHSDHLSGDGTWHFPVDSDTGAKSTVSGSTAATSHPRGIINAIGDGQHDPNTVANTLVTGENKENWLWDNFTWGLEEYTQDGHDADGNPHFTQHSTSPIGTVLGSAIAVQQSMWFAQQNNLLKRMGELRYGARASRPPAGGTPALHSLIENIWLRSYGQQLNVGSQVAGKAYEQLIYGVDLGTDHKFTISADSDLYLGVYAGYGRSDLDYRTPGTDGELNSYYGGLYATWLHASGFYLDATVKAASVDNDLKAPYDSTQLKANYSDINLGGSLELGKKFTFADAWFIEPQFQVNYLHILAENYTAGPLTISAQDLDALQLRIGSVFGRTINLTNSGALQPYIKISGVETISSGGAIRNGYQHIRANTDGARAELGGGLIWQLDTNNQLHLDYEASFGDKYDKPWGLTAGYRHQF
jgi:outer membrane autotransporter protein